MDGIINVYKPIGITSFDVVRQIRKISKMKKVGHAGTLDPAACGVLPVCIGRATKLIDYIMNDFKIYRAHLKLGIITDTYDREGKVVSTSAVNCTAEEVMKTIESFIGEIDQVPPMYSALKVNGKKLYDLARQGIEIERKPRKINIFKIEVLKMELPDIEFQVQCSKGTYIRSLCYDIGDELGCGGAMWGLERLATGKFTKENAIPLENIEEDTITSHLLSMEDALSSFDKISISMAYKKQLLNGVKIMNPAVLNSIETDKLCRVYLDNKQFIGLGQKDKFGFKIVKLMV